MNYNNDNKLLSQQLNSLGPTPVDTSGDVPESFHPLTDAPAYVAPPSSPQQTTAVAGDGTMEVDTTDAPLSVEDHEAIRKHYFSNSQNVEDDFVVNSWRVENYSELPNRATGPVFLAGSDRFPWRILMFPRGNNVDQVSLYLEMADPKGEGADGSTTIIKNGWHVCAEFTLVLSNPNDPTVMHASNAHHRFQVDESDWGFTRFMEVRKMTLPDPQKGVAILENDSLMVTAFVRVVKDETGVLWHNFVNYDSKKETDYVGLKNQGATCYMNSLLQSLYCTPYFRRAVYDIPTEGDEDPSKSVALALQRVFYQLQTSKHAVGTIELTKSFGWDSGDAFLQHDVQEFNRVLQDNLEGKMKDTKADGAISRLFVGKMKSYIKCVNVNYESARHEDYYDIQLNVKGCKTLAESFKNYVAPEMLDGENKYQAEGHGLQDAKKGIVFESFPPVLHLQLKRFEYDVEHDAQVKINDRLEFPVKIDLEDYLSDDADKTENWNYHLHGVLVHSGDLTSGHYFALLKPTKDSKWLKFDDDRVTYVTEREVLEDNSGGDPLPSGGRPGDRLRTLKRFTNAYMLVYVRQKSQDQILKTIEGAEIPMHLKARLEVETCREEERRREAEERHLYFVCNILTDATMQHHQGFDLGSFEGGRDHTQQLPPILPLTDADPPREIGAPAIKNPQTGMLSFRIKKNETSRSMLDALSRELQLPARRLRLWSMVNRQNKTIRPDVPILGDDLDKPLELLRDRYAKWTDWRYYLEIAGEEPLEGSTWFTPVGPSGPWIMLFGKYYDPQTARILVTKPFFLQKSNKVSDAVPILCGLVGLPESTTLVLYEEIKPTMIEPVAMKSSVTSSELQTGDIICFQKSLSPKERESYEYPLITNYFDMLMNQIRVHFKPKMRPTFSGSHEALNSKAITEFDLRLDRKMNYDQVATKVAAALKVDDPLKLRFSAGGSTDSSRVVKRSPAITLHDMLQSSVYGFSPGNPTLFYEILDVSIVELETKQVVKVAWFGQTMRDEVFYDFLLPKQSTMASVAEAIRLKLLQAEQPPPKLPISINQIWFYEAVNNRISRELSHSDSIALIMDHATLYAAWVPPEEKTDVKKAVINVIHVNKESSRLHGVPFRFTIYEKEPFSETKLRLFHRLGLSEKEFERIRFALRNEESSFVKNTPIEDGDYLFDHGFRPTDALALDHPEKKKHGGMERVRNTKKNARASMSMHRKL